MSALLLLVLDAAPPVSPAGAPDAPLLGEGQDALLLVLLIAGVVLTLALAGFFFYVISREEKAKEE